MAAGNRRVLLEMMAGQRVRYGAAIGAMLAATVLLYGSPMVVREAIDRLIREGGVHLRRDLAVAAGLVVLVTAVSSWFSYLRGKWVAEASEAIAKTLRERLYAHLQALPATYHDKAQTGDLVQRCTSDVDTLRMFFNQQVVEIARAVILIVTVVPVMAWLDWRMALAAVGVMPVIVGFAVVFFRKVQYQFKETDEAEGAMTAVLQENLTGIRVVRAFARQEFEKERFDAKNDGHRWLHYRLFKTMAVYWSSSDMLCFTQTAIVLFFGAWRVAHGRMTVGTLVAFLSYAQMYIWPVRQMGRVLTELGKAMVSLGRVREILEAKEESEDGGLIEDGGRARGEIVLEGVSFSHGGKRVLEDVSLRIPAGGTLALLGPSGSGKSTIINLLLRLYDYETGSIRLDGREIRELNRKWVRSQFGVVMQEPFLYSKTLRENLKLGRHDAADVEMLEASQVAAIHESIQGFEKQYETLVGERGVTLSGGQRQRVAIARAILKDAPILVLDDALSAVDTHTEAEILASLRRRKGRQTTILIAHRLSTLMHADQIAVIEHGRVVQVGRHEDLAQVDGLYRRLWRIQGALEEDLGREMGEVEQAVTPLPAGEREE